MLVLLSRDDPACSASWVRLCMDFYIIEQFSSHMHISAYIELSDFVDILSFAAKIYDDGSSNQ